MHRILLLNGPNLNLLGRREPEVYGAATLEEIVAGLKRQAALGEVELTHLQSNAEHALIEAIHRAVIDEVRFIIINPAALTHTSIALRDAMAAVGVPFIEVHLSNIHARESFRRHSYLSDLAEGVIVGLGALGYRLALDAAMARLADA